MTEKQEENERRGTDKRDGNNAEKLNMKHKRKIMVISKNTKNLENCNKDKPEHETNETKHSKIGFVRETGKTPQQQPQQQS